MIEDNSSELQKKDSFKKILAIVLVVLLIIIIGIGVYVLVLKPKDNSKQNDGNMITPTPSPTPTINVTPTPTSTLIIPSDDNEEENIDEIEYTSIGYDIPILDNDPDEIKIAKEKLKLAFNFLSGACFTDSMFCYYDTLDHFKNNFYSIYSTQLDYKDVYMEYILSSNEYETNVINADLVRAYAIKDNKVFHNSCNIGTNDYERMDNFTVSSKTDDTIKVNYKVIYKDQLIGGDEYEHGDAQIVLVKENNEWKILSATIVGMCNSTYKIGK